MAFLNDATWFLLGIAVLLIVLNFIAHRMRKNANSTVRVAFIPPRVEGGSSPELSSKLDAHVTSTNQKLSQLHERLVAVENALLRLQDFFVTTKDVEKDLVPSEIEIIDSPAVVHARTRSKKK